MKNTQNTQTTAATVNTAAQAETMKGESTMTIIEAITAAQAKLETAKAEAAQAQEKAAKAAEKTAAAQEKAQAAEAKPQTKAAATRAAQAQEKAQAEARAKAAQCEALAAYIADLEAQAAALTAQETETTETETTAAQAAHAQAEAVRETITAAVKTETIAAAIELTEAEAQAAAERREAAAAALKDKEEAERREAAAAKHKAAAEHKAEADKATEAAKREALRKTVNAGFFDNELAGGAIAYYHFDMLEKLYLDRADVCDSKAEREAAKGHKAEAEAAQESATNYRTFATEAREKAFALIDEPRKLISIACAAEEDEAANSQQAVVTWLKFFAASKSDSLAPYVFNWTSEDLAAFADIMNRAYTADGKNKAAFETAAEDLNGYVRRRYSLPVTNKAVLATVSVKINVSGLKQLLKIWVRKFKAETVGRGVTGEHKETYAITERNGEFKDNGFVYHLNQVVLAQLGAKSSKAELEARARREAAKAAKVAAALEAQAQAAQQETAQTTEAQAETAAA